MNNLENAFFALCALLVLLGGGVTVAARNPIRCAMGLLTTILGIAGLYLMLSAEFLAAIQILVYAGAVVVLFIFVIMLLGTSATSSRDARTALPRYLGSLAAMLKLGAGAMTQMPGSPAGFGTIEGIGRELFTTELVPFELSGALLLVAVVGAVALARGRQVDPTLLPSAEPSAKPADDGTDPGASHVLPVAKEAHS